MLRRQSQTVHVHSIPANVRPQSYDVALVTQDKEQLIRAKQTPQRRIRLPALAARFDQIIDWARTISLELIRTGSHSAAATG